MVARRPAAPWVRHDGQHVLRSAGWALTPMHCRLLCRVASGLRRPTAGNMDGVLGVLGGFGIGWRTMNDSGRFKTKAPRRSWTNWTNERRHPHMRPPLLSVPVSLPASHTQEWAYARPIAEGLSFGDELKRIGLGKGDEEVGAGRCTPYFRAAHRTGPESLRTEGKDIGVVTRAGGLSWTQVTL